MDKPNFSDKIKKMKRKKDNLVKTCLKRLFDNPVLREKSRMITKYGLDESVERENLFLEEHLEKFRFKLFCLYCVLGFITIFLIGSVILFWLPRLI
ncbi:hypothetical protein P8822_00135 [Bacillus sonorensis]|uniref:hypothetical protein n=1 Tax=Bacillus sonorensis TaxID=119858 RepID=UPI002DBF7E35|nr:hypothetical protein [Bacillus sonorensis]MEC0526222.1 hypothetical protein [Bacillus sonorensis]